MESKHWDEFKAMFGLPNHVEMIPTGEDEVHVHCLGSCALYTYPFTIGYSFPFLSLVKEFCHYYGVCFAQVVPYVYKVIKMLSKFAELAESRSQCDTWCICSHLASIEGQC